MKKVLVFAFLSLLLFSSNPIFSQSVRNPVTGKKVLAVKKITTSLGTSYILIHDKKKKEEVFYVQSNDKKEEVRFMLKITNEIFNKTEYYSIKSGNQEILQLSETRYFSFTSGININAEIMVPYPSKDGFNFLGYIDKSGSGLYWQEYIAIIDVQSKKLITPFLNNTYFELFNADRPECKMNYHEIGRDGINWLKKCGKNWQLFDNEGCSLSWSYPNGNINVGPVYKKDGSANYSLVEQQKRKAKEQNDYKNNSSPQCSWLHEIPGETTKETMFGTQTTTHLITYTWSGGCENGLLSGKGKLVWFDKGVQQAIYEGEMKNGKANGVGTTYYSDGGKHSGTYKNGLQHGQGKYANAYDTENFEGEYQNGNRWNGSGLVYANGTEYATWTNGVRSIGIGSSSSSSSSSNSPSSSSSFSSGYSIISGTKYCKVEADVEGSVVSIDVASMTGGFQICKDGYSMTIESANGKSESKTDPFYSHNSKSYYQSDLPLTIKIRYDIRQGCTDEWKDVEVRITNGGIYKIKLDVYP